MKKYRLVIPPEIEESIRHLHPEVKSKIRIGLEEIEKSPDIGKQLKHELSGLNSHRVGLCRIVYEIKRKKERIHIVDIAKRSVVYEQLTARRRRKLGGLKGYVQSIADDFDESLEDFKTYSA